MNGIYKTSFAFIGLLLFVCLVGVMLSVQNNLSTQPNKTLSKSTEKKTIYEWSCALGSGYDYVFNQEYPLLVTRRMDFTQQPNRELIAFPGLPISETEFLARTVITKDEAHALVSGVTINFSDSLTPQPHAYTFVIQDDQIKDAHLTRMRAPVCNSTVPQGSVDSTIRVVWKITVSTDLDYDWLVYIDAVTAEIVKVIRSTIKLRNQDIPGWDTSFDLPRVGDEYVQPTYF